MIGEHQITRASQTSRERPGCDSLKRKAANCAYCGCEMEPDRKQTDHMTPLALGGDHSLRNIVIVCPGCNRKGSLNYAEWIERVEPEHKARAIG